MKTCRTCGEDKPADQFHLDRGGRRRVHCKTCVCARVNAWRVANADVLRERKRVAYVRDRALHRNRKLVQNYGITRDDYEAMLEAQQGVCAVCQRPETKRANNGSGELRELSVDHCHATGQVRGLLCSTCNSAIGLLDEDESRLLAAISYLRRHTASRTPS